MNENLHAAAVRHWPAIGLSVGLVVLTLVSAAIGSNGFQQVVTEMMVRVVVVTGIYIFVGNSGILSFGHISFMAIGAYATAWFTCCTLPMVKPLYMPGLPSFLADRSYPFVVGIASAATLSGLVGLVLGSVLMRLSGIASSIATFAMLAVVVAVYSNWDSVTGGTSSVSNIPVYVGPWVATCFAIAAIFLAFWHQISRYGLMLRASRDDEVAARSSGVNVVRSRLMAFVISAVCVGVGGALYANLLGIVTVDTFYLSITFLTLAMLIVGGVGSLAGAVIGVLFITFLTQILRALEDGVGAGSVVVQMPKGLQEVFLGVIMILILILRPAGVMNGKELPFPARRGASAIAR